MRACVLVVLLLATVAVAQPARLRCRVGDRQVFVSQPTAYEVTFRGEENVKIKKPPEVDGLRFELISEGERGTGSFIINGRRTDFTEWGATWRVTGERAGRFQIPAPTIEAGGRVVPGSPVTLEVAPEPKQDLVHVEFTVDDPNPVVGQAVGLTVDVFMKHLPKPAPETDPLYYHSPRSRMAAPQLLVPWLPKPPDPFSETAFDANAWGAGVMSSGSKGLRIGGFRGRYGFTGEVADVRRADATGAQARYRRYRFHVKLRAAKTGTFDLGRAIIDGQVANKVGAGFQPKYVYTRSRPLTLTVTEPPATGRPAEYSGAVGRFEMEVQPPTPTVVNVGSPLYLTVVVKGDGFLDGVGFDLAQQLGPAWRVEDPKITDSLKPGEERPQGFPNRAGTWRQFDFKLRPLETDLTEVPSLAFAFFDTGKKEFARVTSAAFPIEVRPAGVAVDEGVVDATGGKKGATELIATGLSANEDDLNKLGNHAASAWPFLVMAGVLLPLWLLTGRLVTRRRALRADPAILRRKNARARAMRGLKAARGQAATAPGDATTAAVAALRGLVADLEDRPDDAVTSGDVAGWLDEQDVDPDARASLAALLEAGEAAAFGGGALDSSALGQALAAADAVVARKPRNTRLGAVLIACLALGTTAPGQNADLFQQAQTAFSEGRYADSAKLFERMLDDGYENGYVLYNLGNAWLQAGEIGRALSAYRRAQWLLPGDANLERNLGLALDRRRQNLSDVDGAVIDKILFWRPRLSFSTQGWLAVLALAAGIVCSLIRTITGRPIPALKTATIVGLIASALFATSASITWIDQSSKAHGAVIDDDTPLLQWPAADADLSYEQPLHDGDEFSVVARRDGWLKIRVADRYEGWIDATRAVTW